MQAAGLHAAEHAPRVPRPSAASPCSEPSSSARSPKRRKTRSEIQYSGRPMSALVELVDEVLAREHAVQRRRSGERSRSARSAVAAEQERRRREAGERERDRDDDAAASRRRAASAATAGSGSCGSRKCGTATKPPSAESAASTTSTPVIESGDSWTWCSTSASMRERPKNVSHSRRNM